MLEFTDAPYEFFPAKPNSFLLWLGRLFNQRRNLPSHRHLISEFEIRGTDRLVEARRLGGKRWFFLANHSTHSDAQILNEAQRQLKVHSCYMAAYDVFLRGKLQAWVMQRAGCFSVNRDASDSRSMREAIRILTENRYGLTLFPEGNVYLMNDRVTPFLDGAAFIGMKAQKQLGTDTPIFVIPTSIKATHLTDQRDAIRAQLAQVATDIGLEFDRTALMLDEIKRVGLSALDRSLKQRGLIPNVPDDLPLRAHLEHCAEHMTKGLEDKIGLPTKATTPLNQR
ncbi:MAG: 1-acyl-sn-glycerol-3-phosphate acyltransferase, partial [Planctomycetota bacterium]